MARKKKYNPFKMVGSYVGAVVGFFINIITNGKIIQILPNYNILIEYGESVLPYTYGTLIYAPIIGFLIGWGIETLARKNKWFGLKKYP